MKLSVIFAAIVLSLVLLFGTYHLGREAGAAAELAAALQRDRTAMDDAIRLASAAMKRTLDAEQAQRDLAATHDAELQEARRKTRVITQDVIEYVERNPTDPACRLDAGALRLLNMARAAANAP